MLKIVPLATLLALLPAAPARAQGPSAAQTLILSGTRHFDRGEFNEALNDFKESYRLSDDAQVLYQLAQCHRALKHDEHALQYYHAYLRRLPDAPNRREVEQKIAVLEGEKPEMGPEPSPAPVVVVETPAPVVVERAAPAPEPEPLYKKWWLWTAVGGVAVVAIVVGISVGAGANSSLPGSSFPGVSF